MDVRKVLCPIDFSEPSREAMRTAVDLARRFGGSVTLLHVYQIPGYAYPEGIVLASPEVMNELLDRIDKELGAWKAEAVGIGAARVESLSLQGNAAAEIVRYAEEGGFDLVVMGTHGRTGLSHALLGSIAEKVVRRAKVPVLTVRPAERRGAAPPAPA